MKRKKKKVAKKRAVRRTSGGYIAMTPKSFKLLKQSMVLLTKALRLGMAAYQASAR